MSDRLQQVLVIIATIVMIILNGLAATGVLGGINTGAVSAKYDTVITPPTFAFGVWSAIYLGLIVFTIVQALPSKREAYSRLRIPYLVSCAANSLWLWLWAMEMMVLCQILISVLLISLANINIKLKPAGNMWDALAVKLPFGLYFGWVTAATILNFSIMLLSLKPEFRDLSLETKQAIGCSLMLVAGVIGVTVRFGLRNYIYPLGIAWATLAIALGQEMRNPVMLGAIVAFVACLIASGSFIMDMRDSRSNA